MLKGNWTEYLKSRCQTYIPQIDALHVWGDVRWDGCEVPERAVHLGGDVAGAEPGTGAAATEGEAEGEEGPQAPGPAAARGLHPAGERYTAILHSKSQRADACRENKPHKRLPWHSCRVAQF